MHFMAHILALMRLHYILFSKIKSFFTTISTCHEKRTMLAVDCKYIQRESCKQGQLIGFGNRYYSGLVLDLKRTMK